MYRIVVFVEEGGEYPETPFHKELFGSYDEADAELQEFDAHQGGVAAWLEIECPRCGWQVAYGENQCQQCMDRVALRF